MPNRIRDAAVGASSALLCLVFAALACSPNADAPREGGGSRPPAAESASRPPDGPGRASRSPSLIVLISIDTLRPDHLGSYGYGRATSPILDGIAREGIVFEDASSTAPWTLPAHASMLTGLYPLRHGAVSTSRTMARNIPTLASLLRDAGFQTAAVVNSTYLKQNAWGLDRGFEEHFHVPEDSERRGPSTWVTDQAMRWIRERDGRPMFLFMHYYDVHSSYYALPKFERLFVGPYDGIATGSVEQLYLADLDEEIYRRCYEDPSYHRCRFPSGRVIDSSVVRPKFDERDIAHLVALYDAGIRQLDDELGRFFSFLRKEGLLGDALLVVTSDHGEEFMEHGGLEHSTTQYEDTIRIPLLLRGPGLPKGRRIAAPVSLIDLAPTILDLAGVTPPEGLDGIDLSPLWSRGDTSVFEQRSLFSEASGMRAGQKLRRAIRKGRYKLHYEFVNGTFELYDLAEDPDEQRDIAGEKPQIASRLIEQMKARYRTPVAVENSELDLGEQNVERLKALGYLN